MPNASTYHGENKAILLYGGAGAGKSTQLLTFPPPRFAFIFDPAGLDTYAGEDVDYELFRPESVQLKRVQVTKEGAPTPIIVPDPKVYYRFEQVFEKMVKENAFSKYNIVSFDSLTMLAEAMMAHILDLNGVLGKNPEINHWGILTDSMNKLMTSVVSQGASVMLMAHVELMQLKETGAIENHLLISRRLKGTVPIRYGHVFPTYVKGNQTIQYMIRTRPSTRWPNARTSLKGLENEVDVTIDFGSMVKDKATGKETFVKKDPVGQGIAGVFHKAGYHIGL